MLSRVANNLFWLGRFVERTEHISRYLKVQYFSSLDAPALQEKEFVLQSIMNMVGLEYKPGEMSENDVLVAVAFDYENPSSIINSVFKARENARSTRDMVSTEIWENMNKFYHYVVSYPVQEYLSKGLYDFTQTVLERCSIVKGSINNTLIHDETWAFIQLGIHLERAVQIDRMTWNKLYDIQRLNKQDTSLEVYQWTTLLKSAEALDMSRKYYKTFPKKENTLEFLILNHQFPRSVTYNLIAIKDLVDLLSSVKVPKPGSLEFKIGKFMEEYKYKTIDEIPKEEELKFLNDTLTRIYELNEYIAETYLDV